MSSFTIEEICTATGGELLRGAGKGTLVEGISTDTRTIQEGQLFIPLIGENFDGHKFIQDAALKGAAAIITQYPDIDISGEIPVILVKNTLTALQDIAAFHRKRFDIPIVAVTGSTGKTTTKDMIYYVLSQRYNVLRTEGNLNNEIGLPHTLLRLNQSHEIAVVEMGMSGFGEIHRLAEIARPQLGVITNIGVSHIEKLGSKENILKAKMELFDFFTSKCTAIVNGDDELLRSIGGMLPFNVEYFGTDENANYRATGINVNNDEKISYEVNIKNNSYNIDINVPGIHNIYNSLAAIAVGMHFGLRIDEIQKGLRHFKPGAMRLNIIKTHDNIKIIDDVYNASPDSMTASIAILSQSKGNRKIAVLGDMLEMGHYSEKAHRDVGAVVAKYGIDILITRGEDSRWIGEQAKKLGMDEKCIYNCTDNEDVIKLLDTLLREGDTILVKGSRGMKMEEIVSYLAQR